MAINLYAANNQAGEITSYITQLRQAKNQLTSYKSSLLANWQGREATYISQGIDKAIGELDTVMRELEELASDVKNVANAIHQEEVAAAKAAAARAERERRLLEAQNEYNTAYDELDKLMKEREKLEKRMKAASKLKNKLKLQEEWNALEKKIEEAETKYEACKQALSAARG